MKKILYYVLLGAISATFLVASYSKLTANPGAEAAFTTAHLPIWFMYFIGVAEACGVVGLWIKRLTIAAACGLFIILAGAIIITAIYVSVPEALFPLVTATLLGVIVWLHCKNRAIAAPL